MPGLTRILLTGSGEGGIWRYNLELARGLLAAGVEPMLAVLGRPPGPACSLDAAAIPGLRIIPTGLPGDAAAADAAGLREIGAALAGLAARLEVDTVHLHTPALASEVSWAMPVIAVVHADDGVARGAWHGGPREILGWREQATARGLAEADCAVAPSRSFARALVRLYRPGRSIEVVPHGRTHLPPPPSPRRHAVLTAAPLWNESKNVGLLDRAAGALDAPVLAAGSVTGPDGHTAEFPRLHLLGELTHPALAATMATTSVFAAPSRHEPFGWAVLEAAQSGMALALADTSTFRELWDGAALFFHPDDPGALGDVLNRLLARPEAAAARARKHAEKYAGSTMVAAILALHRPLATGRLH